MKEEGACRSWTGVYKEISATPAGKKMQLDKQAHYPDRRAAPTPAPPHHDAPPPGPPGAVSGSSGHGAPLLPDPESARSKGRGGTDWAASRQFRSAETGLAPVYLHCKSLLHPNSRVVDCQDFPRVRVQFLADV